MAKKYTLKQLTTAIENDDATLTKTIIDSDEVNIAKQSSKLLRCAIENNCANIFSLLIDNEQINLTAGKNLAIKLCIEHNRTDMMNALLKTSAFDSLSNAALYNFFKKAAELQHNEITKALIKKHGDQFQLSTALTWIIKHNLAYAAKQLLKIYNNAHPLSFKFLKQAIKDNGSVELLSALIHSGKFDVQTAFNFSIITTPFSPQLLEILLSHPDVDPGVNSNFALQEMVKYGHIETIKLFLAHPKVDPTDEDNFAIRRAVFYEQTEVVKLLLTHMHRGIDPNTDNHYCLKLAAKNNNLPMILVLLPYCFIHRMKLSSILQLDTNNLSQEIIDYFQHPESYIAAHPKLTPVQKLAFTILEFKKNIQKWEKEKEDALIHDQENAMNDESVIRAKATFERKVEPAFTDAFLSYADDQAEDKELSAVIQIEQKIRESILDAILASNPLPDTLTFIQKNKTELKKATDVLMMQQAREQHFNTRTNLCHLAWRGYDVNAPSKGFDNLLTPPEEEAVVFTTAAAKIDDNALLNTTASLYVRKMVAYYYLLAIDSKFIQEDNQPIGDETKKEILSERMANFISELADMRSAHSEDHTDGSDAPSCYPGYLGRITNMGFKHPLTKETISTKNFVADRLETYIFTEFKKQLDTCDSEAEGQQLLEALILLSETGWRAQNIFLGQETYEDKLLNERDLFIQNLGSQDQNIETINQELENANRPALNTMTQTNGISEQSYVFQYLLDPARGTLSGKFSAEYSRWVKQFNATEAVLPPTAPQIIEDNPKTEKLWLNPYISSAAQIGNLLTQNKKNPILATNMEKRLANINIKLTIFDALENIVNTTSSYQLDTYDMACYQLFAEKLTETIFQYMQEEKIEHFSLTWYKSLSKSQLELLHNDLQEKLSDCSDEDAFAGALAIFEEFTSYQSPFEVKKSPSFTPLYQETKTPPPSPSKQANAANRSPLKQEKALLIRRNSEGTTLF